MKKSILFSIIPLMIFYFVSEAVIAQNAEITSGTIYTIKSKLSNRLLSVKNSSLSNSANVETWIDTKSDAQRWVVTQVSDGIYTMENVGSGKFLHTEKSIPANSVNVDQYDYINNNTIKWKIVSEGNGIFRVLTAANDNFTLDLASSTNANGANVGIYTNNNSDAQKWIFEQEIAKDAAPTAAIRDEVFQAWQNKYYKKASIGYVIGSAGFWGVAEMMEILLDAYETTGHAKYREMFDQVYTNFYATQGNKAGDWMSNEFNDDIQWICIACTRAYLMFGTQKYLTIAKTHFDKMYSRAFISTYGLLAWKGNGNVASGTTSCANGPAEVEACYLALATGNDAYYTKAKNLYAHHRKYLFDANSGQVYDSFGKNDDGSYGYNYWASTYNQGTFLGAAVMLYERYGDEMYLEDAKKIAKYSREHLCNGDGVVSVETGGNDLPGFKGILMRYMRKFIVDLRQTDYIPWLHTNAKVVYNNRNSEGIIWTAWAEKAAEATDYDVFGASTAVSLMVNLPLTSSQIVKDAYQNIEAEDFDYISGPRTEACTADGGGENIGGTLNGHYTGYMNIDFGDNITTSAELRVSNATNVGTIEIRTGSPAGDLIGTATIPVTGGLNTYTTVTCTIKSVYGLNNIYLVFKGTGALANLNYFKFNLTHSICPDITDISGILTASNQGASENVGIQNLIDDKPYTNYSISTSETMPEIWFIYQSPNAVLLKGYSITSSNDSPEFDPKKWTLEGSSDGINWTKLDVQENILFTGRNEKKTFPISTASYTYFRLTVIERNTNNATGLQFAEWQLYGSSVSQTDLTDNGGAITSEYQGATGTDEDLANLIDNNFNTTFRIKNNTQSWIQYHSTTKVKIQSYSITSADDKTKNPTAWSLYGSSDGKTWTLMDERKNQVFSTNFSTQIYPCNNPYSYSYFKLDIVSNNGSSDLQMAELQLYGLTTPKVEKAFSGSYVTIGDTAMFTVLDARVAGSTYQWLKDGVKINGATNYSYTVPLVGSQTVGKYSCLVTNNSICIASEESELKSKNPIFAKDITDNLGILSSTHNDSPAGESLTKLTDNSCATKYCTKIAVGDSIVIKYKSSVSVVLGSYTLTSANDASERDPKTWTLQASNDGTSWVDLDHQTNQTFSERNLKKTFYLANREAYTYFKLNITELSTSATTIFQLSEWQLLELDLSEVKPVSSTVFSIYPNPATDFVFIQTGKDSDVRIYDFSGRLVDHEFIQAGTHSINVSSFAKGLYIIHTDSNKQILNIK